MFFSSTHQSKHHLLYLHGKQIYCYNSLFNQIELLCCCFFPLKMHWNDFNVHSKRSFYNLGILRIRFLSIKWITQINRFIICLESIDKEKFQPKYIWIFKLYTKCETKYCQYLLSKLSHTHWVSRKLNIY